MLSLHKEAHPPGSACLRIRRVPADRLAKCMRQGWFSVWYHTEGQNPRGVQLCVRIYNFWDFHKKGNKMLRKY